MYITLAPANLAEIVTNLLVHPELVGELDSRDNHARFVQAIAQVVADFCGGHIQEVYQPDSSSALIVTDNDACPDPDHNIWTILQSTLLNTQHAESHSAPKRNDNDRTEIPISLYDECVEPVSENAYLHGAILFSEYGIECRFNGYSDCASINDMGTPIFIEFYDQDLRVLVYADINREEPTHVISLAGAQNTHRQLESGS